jgi:hypothetical protein
MHDALDRAEPRAHGKLGTDPARLAAGGWRSITRALLLAVLDGGEALRRHVLLATANRTRFGDCAFYDDRYVLE